MKKVDVGVAIGRWQTPALTEAHRRLLDYVSAHSYKLLILIGESSGQPSTKHPLNYSCRFRMLMEAYPDAIILPLADTKTDEEWSQSLDNLVRLACPKGEVILFGGRDSFAPHYSGKFKINEIDQELLGDESMAATQERVIAAARALNTVDFRAGVCYGVMNRFPVSYQTVDAAITHFPTPTQPRIILGKKHGSPLLCFPGGFVDPRDLTLEKAVLREVNEEVQGLELDTPKYLGSFRIDDWRYRGTEDGVMTAFFQVPYLWGAPEGGDDLEEPKWYNLKDIRLEDMGEQHRQLLQHLKLLLL